MHNLTKYLCLTIKPNSLQQQFKNLFSLKYNNLFQIEDNYTNFRNFYKKLKIHLCI